MVIYRNFTVKDSKRVYQLLNENPDIPYWCGFPQPKSISEARNYVRMLSKRPYWYAIENNGNIIGCISLHNNEIGYWLTKEYRRQGYMTNAIQYIINKAFNELSINTIWCGWFDGNEASKNIQLKLGFKKIKKINVPYATGTEYITILKKEE